MHSPDDVLAFWFGEPARDLAALKSKLRRWFMGGPEVDDAIKRDFGAEVEAALSGGGVLGAWLEEPKGWLALILVLDQFTRNVYRGDAKTHAGEARAVKLAIDSLDAGKARELSIEERHFAIMPLLHAEEAACQARYAREIAEVVAAAPEDQKPFFAAGVEQSEIQRDHSTLRSLSAPQRDPWSQVDAG